MEREIRDRIRKLESVLSDIELERQARLEAFSTNRATLRSQINRIRETFRRLLHEDTTLAERIRTLFREQGITIASILTAIGMAISTLVLALTGGGGSAPVPVSQFILPPGQVAPRGASQPWLACPRGATCPGISCPPPWLPSPPGGNISRLVYLAPRG